MRPFAEPQTFVPGATRRIDPDTLMPEVDKKGRPLWDMPSPIRYAEHIKRRKHKKTGEVIEEEVMVPIYQGMGARMANWYRSQARRTMRKAAGKEMGLKEINETVGNAISDHLAMVKKQKESKDA